MQIRHYQLAVRVNFGTCFMILAEEVVRYLIKSIDTVLERQSGPHEIDGHVKSDHLAHVV